jgi:hypothetical protein
MANSPDIHPDRALFGGDLIGLAVACYTNERPFQGLAGLMDWRFQGALSEAVRAGMVSGTAGECTYLPIRRRNRTYHLFLVGCGHTSSPGHRSGAPEEALEKLSKNLTHLKIGPIGVSKSDFGPEALKTLSKLLKSDRVWVVQ